MLTINDLKTSENCRLLRSHLSWADEERKFLYIANPKVACTKIKKDLQAICGLTPNPPKIHGRSEPNVEYVKSFEDLSDDSIIYLLESPEVYRFTFVRNPYTRLISAYKTKIVEKGDPTYKWVRNKIRGHLGLGQEAISFASFINFLDSAKGSPAAMDRHWVVQTEGIFFQEIDYTFIGKLENFAVDYQTALTHLEASASLIENAGKKSNASAEKAKLKDLPPIKYTEDVAQKAYELYKTDFDSFDYDLNSWKSASG